MERIINVGLVGYGGAGKVFHAPVMTSVNGLNLYKVCDGNARNIRQLKEKYGEIKTTDDFDDILKDEEIQLVVLAVPNTVHYELAVRALEHGKNVVVEKPFTVTSEEADKLIKLAKDKNKLLTVHHNRRWDSDFRTVEKVIKEKLLGNVVEYEVHYDRFRNYFKENAWREKDIPGSGILYDLGSHLIDQAQCLFGLPQEVFGDLRIQREGGKTIDNFEVILSYPNLKVTLKAGMLVRESGPHFTIYGTEGSFIKYGMDIQEEDLKNDVLPKHVENWGKEPEILWGNINTMVNGLHIKGTIESEPGDYREFYRNVYEAIIGNEPLKVTPVQARNTIRIIELAEQSSAERHWVRF
ncbi:MAG: Gfo/Idh/MocA family oxidoreductase [Bacillota bacterium]|nr:Gfo/Idh/MocA family oxidoreductase [Bacillota bacterium]